MSDQTTEQAPSQETKNLYKTSKSTWFFFGLLGVFAIIIMIIMMRKKKDGSVDAIVAPPVS